MTCRSLTFVNALPRLKSCSFWAPGTSTNGGMLTHLDAGLNGHACSGFHLHFNGLVDRLGQLLLGRIAHCLGPDVESPFPGWGNFPETPDAFPFIVAAI